jgi:hypothetical protein
MATGTTGDNGSTSAPATRVLVRVVVYYLVLGAIGAVVWRYLPRTHLIATNSLDALFGSATELVRAGKSYVAAPVDQETLAVTVTLAMLAAALLALPVAWIYTLTRSRRGYQQSIVQMLVVLPVVVAGIIVLVKYSIALAFSLGGIAAAVRFRNTLDDSKDAVYVFLVIGLGIAAAIDLPVAMMVSLLFNATVVALWMSDFGRTPVALEGRLAERRLERARQLARTGTFVARIDDEVLREMTAEQLEGVARRAWRRAQEHHPEGSGVRATKERVEVRLRLKMRSPAETRAVVEARLSDSTKRWTAGLVRIGDDGITTVDYVVLPKKRQTPDELMALIRAAAGPDLVEVELR